MERIVPTRATSLPTDAKDSEETPCIVVFDSEKRLQSSTALKIKKQKGRQAGFAFLKDCTKSRQTLDISMAPKVSVIIPVYNREKYIGEAISSILAQSLTNFELLLIDDGSTDNSVEIMRSYRDPRVRLVRNEQNLGIPKTRNKGTHLARGDYIAILDSDNIALSDRLAKQVAFLDDHQDYVLVGSGAILTDKKGNFLKKTKRQFVSSGFERAGMRAEKIRDCYPVVNYERFLDSSPNGQTVMNGGACLPKKQMEDFFELAVALPEMEFNLYAMGYQVKGLHQVNGRLGSPGHIKLAVEPRDMPREYKQHRWLVYTASPENIKTGWPVMIAEAQASGVGICMRKMRPDLKEYVGECGFLYDSLDEVRNIISQPFPEELRQIGFKHAKQSDI